MYHRLFVMNSKPLNATMKFIAFDILRFIVNAR